MESDLWALSLVVYECMSQCMIGAPFMQSQGLQEDFLSFLEEGNRPTLRAEWGAAICAAMSQAWCEVPEERGTAAELRDSIQVCIEERPRQQLAHGVH